MQENGRKRKMISLRLSDSEYDVLMSHYRSYGARNVSDFARLALQRVMTDSVQSEDGLEARVRHLEQRLRALEEKMAQPFAASGSF